MIARLKRAIKRAVLRRLLDLAHRCLADVPVHVIRDAFRQSFRAGDHTLARFPALLRELLGDRITPDDVALLDLIDASIPPGARPN